MNLSCSQRAAKWNLHGLRMNRVIVIDVDACVRNEPCNRFLCRRSRGAWRAVHILYDIDFGAAVIDDGGKVGAAVVKHIKIFLGDDKEVF